MLSKVFVSTACVLFLFAGSAQAKTGYVKIGKSTDVYINYDQPAEGQPTVVLLNGLTYSLGDWDSYVKALKKLNPGLGILRFDMIGMGRTLLKGKLPVDYAIPHTDQVELTSQLMRTLNISKAYITGLSYGGGIAVAFASAHPEQVEQVILMAPFTEPMKAMDQWIRLQVATNRFSVPFNPASDDELYDWFLRNFIYASYPSLEPSVVENPYKLEGVYRMIQGIRHYDTLKDASNLPAGSTHLIVASQDQYIEGEVMDRFWNAVPRSARASRINVSRSKHKIPEEIPAFAAAWTVEILSKRSELNRGLVFIGSTSDFNARSGSTVIQLKK